MVEYYLEEKLFVTQKTESVKLNKNYFAEFYPKFLRMVETHMEFYLLLNICMH